MSVIAGLGGSFAHEDNGMTMADMQATLNVARRLNTVIMFRSTGPWSLRWIERGYPTKNFHAKGKSSDWGPQAGFVPHEGEYSKVGHIPADAAKGTKKNNAGIRGGFINKVQLELTREELDIQQNRAAKGRLALRSVEHIAGSADLILRATRPGDGADFSFLAQESRGTYKIFVIDTENPNASTEMLARTAPFSQKPLNVMSSAEVGAGNRPMTGDYDLMAVCPTWNDYGRRALAPIHRDGLQFAPDGRRQFSQPGLDFDAGVNMDQSLDMRLTTGAASYGHMDRTQGSMGVRPGDALDEHDDMGNVTPRILECVNALNAEMGAGANRRVHHNAESHRSHIFGAITGNEMVEGEGLPITGFHPRMLGMYDEIVTITSFGAFENYANAMHQAGFYVPKNWTWNMSIRNRRGHIGHNV